MCHPMLKSGLEFFGYSHSASAGAGVEVSGLSALLEQERFRADEAEAALERERVRANEAENLAEKRRWEVSRLRGRRNYWRSRFRDCRAKLTVERKLGKVYERALKRLGSSGEKYKKRLFGRRSEKKQGEGSGRGPGQQPGSKGHGRTPRELEEKEEHHDPAPEDRKCPCCGEPYVVLALKPLRNQFSSTLSAWVLRGIRNIGCQIAALEVDFKLNFGPETGRSGQISRFGDDSTHLAPGACGQS